MNKICAGCIYHKWYINCGCGYNTFYEFEYCIFNDYVKHIRDTVITSCEHYYDGLDIYDWKKGE